MNNNVSFTSNIKPCTLVDYAREISTIYRKSYKNYVPNPWTKREIIKTSKGYTDGIYDCTAGGITDGKDVVMFHICPTMQENRNFSEIDEVITEKLQGMGEKLSGFLLGSINRFNDSKMLMEKFKRFMKDRNIPLTSISGSRDVTSNIVYNAKKDEWLISNSEINNSIKHGERNPLTLLKRCYTDVQISPKDTITV